MHGGSPAFFSAPDLALFGRTAADRSGRPGLALRGGLEMPNGRKPRESPSAGQRLQVVSAVLRMLAQLLQVLHDLLGGGGPGWPISR